MVGLVRTSALAILLALSLVAGGLAGCANQVPTPSAALGPDGLPVEPGTARDFSINVGNTVYFTTDSWDLTPDAQQTLRNQATWLNQYPQHTILVEGHADERGTREYNLALGARRAATVRDFLTAQGLNAARMRTLSYGKERPVAVCDDISCWSQNRRSVTQLNERAGS
jgi:peptidoglycan-associated lipoprotein